MVGLIFFGFSTFNETSVVGQPDTEMTPAADTCNVAPAPHDELETIPATLPTGVGLQEYFGAGTDPVFEPPPVQFTKTTLLLPVFSKFTISPEQANTPFDT